MAMRFQRMRSYGRRASNAGRAAYAKLKSTKKTYMIVAVAVAAIVFYFYKKGKITINK